MKTLIMLLSVAIVLCACGSNEDTPTADDVQKDSSSVIDEAKKEADKAASDAKEKGEDAKKEASDALKKIGG